MGSAFHLTDRITAERGAAMREIPYQKRMEAVEMYLEGLSSNQVVERTGISKGTVIAILQDARTGKYPVPGLAERMDETHTFAAGLAKEGLSLEEARLGILFLKRLQKLRVEPGRLEEWVEFSSHVGPEPPEGLMEAAMEFHKLAHEKGTGYPQLLAEVRELAARRDNLTAEVGDLQVMEERAKHLHRETEEAEKALAALKARRDELKSEVEYLRRLLEKKADTLGIPIEEVEARLKELLSLEDEIAATRRQRASLKGEVDVLSERRQQMSTSLARGMAQLEKDMELLSASRRELAEMGELKGRLAERIEQVEWAVRIMPFLSDPDRVADDDFSLIAIVVACVDRWLSDQPSFRYRSDPAWSDIKAHVHRRRMEARAAHERVG